MDTSSTINGTVSAAHDTEYKCAQSEYVPD